MVDIIEVDSAEDSSSVSDEESSANASTNDSRSETKGTRCQEKQAGSRQRNFIAEASSAFFSDSSSSGSDDQYQNGLSCSSSSSSSSCSSKLETVQGEIENKPLPRCIHIDIDENTSGTNAGAFKQSNLDAEGGQKVENSNQIEGEKGRDDNDFVSNDLKFDSYEGVPGDHMETRSCDDDDDNYYEDENIIFSTFDDGSVGRATIPNEKSANDNIDYGSTSKNDTVAKESFVDVQRKKICVNNTSSIYRSDRAGSNDSDGHQHRVSSSMIKEKSACTSHEMNCENEMQKVRNEIPSISPSKISSIEHDERYQNLKIQNNERSEKEKGVNTSVKILPSNPYKKKTSTLKRFSSNKDETRYSPKKSNSAPLSQFCSSQEICNGGSTGDSTARRSNTQNNVEIQEGATFSSASSLFFAKIENGDFDRSVHNKPRSTSLARPARQHNPSAYNLCNASASISQYEDETKGETYCNNGETEAYLPKQFRPNQTKVPQANKEIMDMDKISSMKTTLSIDEQRIVTDRQKEHLPIDPILYQPLAYVSKPDPIIHTFTSTNCPSNTRRMVPVSSLFSSPTSKLWTCKFHSFNHIQSQMSQKIVNSHHNIVVSAPTGAGKTCIFELAMAKLLTSEIGKRDEIGRSSTRQTSNARKIVYLSPSKALCEERYDDWSKRFASIDKSIQITMVTGDSDTSSMQKIASAHIILTTPEKWDGITRRWTNHLFLIGSVKLLLIDEVHLLGDESRGGCLEAVLCRMKTVQRAARAKQVEREETSPKSARLINDALATNMRIVAVSATLPNISDIAAFLDAHEAFAFDSSFRPVTLSTHVVGLGHVGKNQFLFDKGLSRHVPDLLKRFSRGKPSIIFCHTKKQTEALAKELLSSQFKVSNNSELLGTAKKTRLLSLQRCLQGGMAFHHAGMEAEDRKLVEHSFSRGIIKCLCATSTLAMGVNLPAHLVVIKGTSMWRGTAQGYQEMDKGTLLQMMGRAGRPGFDTSGTAVIMTDSKSKRRYEEMSSGLEVVESMLLKRLVETLNSEISQHVIVNVRQSIDWLKGTFFFRRVRKNTKYYGMQGKSEKEIESYLFKRCTESLEQLDAFNIINLSTDGLVSPRSASHVMSRHIVPFSEMSAIIDIPHDAEARQIIEALSKMNGLQFPVRRSEKSQLNAVHKLIKYKIDGAPSKVRVQKPDQKAFVLLQAAIGQNYLQDFTLRQEMSMGCDYASRLLQAAEEFSVEESKHGKVALECLLLRRCIASSLWGPGDGALNQLGGVGQKTAAKLRMNNIRTFADIMSKSSNEIEQACGRKPPFGQEIRKAVSKLLSKTLSVSAHMKECDDGSYLVCDISHRETQPDTTKASEEESRIVTYTLAVFTDRPGGLLMFRRHICCARSHRIRCPTKFGRIYVRLVSNLVGLDEQLIVDGDDVIEKSRFKLTPKSTKTPKKETVKSKSPPPTYSLKKMVDGVDDMRLQSRFRIDGTGSGSSHIPECDYPLIRKNGLVTPSDKRSNNRYYKNKNQHHKSMASPKTVTPSPQSVNSTRSVTASSVQFYSRDGYGNRANAKLEIKAPNSTLRKSPPGPLLGIKRNLSQKNGQIARDHSKGPKRLRAQNSTWQRKRFEQQSLQQRAFGSQKENPFSSFKFDPNNVENQLEQESNNASQTALSSDISASFPLEKSEVNLRHSQRRSRFLSAGSSRGLQTPSKRFQAMRRQRTVSAYPRISMQQLLLQKATEQETYSTASRNWNETSRCHQTIEPLRQMNTCIHPRNSSLNTSSTFSSHPQPAHLSSFIGSPLRGYGMIPQTNPIENINIPVYREQYSGDTSFQRPYHVSYPDTQVEYLEDDNFYPAHEYSNPPYESFPFQNETQSFPPKEIGVFRSMETSNDTSQSGYIPAQDFRVIPECQDYMMFENDVGTSNNNTYQCTDQAFSAPHSSHEAHGHQSQNIFDEAFF